MSELSLLLPDMNKDEQPVIFPTDAEPKSGQPMNALGVQAHPWIKRRSILQNEFARLQIWRSDFGSENMKLLLSGLSPLRRTILETILSIAETLLSMLQKDGDQFKVEQSLQKAADALQQMVEWGRSADWPDPPGIIPVPTDYLGVESRGPSRLGISNLITDLKDDDGDSVMSGTNATQATIALDGDVQARSGIEKLRQEINSLQDLEISMRRILPHLRQKRRD
ncbi:hypothetical protein BHE90_011060 [Fusarium euwallaceae]|uniref:Uncharacterized protein n=2 Tax=Fusarium solani species complex TaxID=232080 RepID=A0A430LFI4_9HYPO|nr:hypothetical protein CEP51_016244 [Fusarium floridanum]RTE74470.1 hypothetical protein BHE90_011060 [Fusarium euwallaceae]